MLSAHATLAYFAVAVPALAAAVGGFVYWRRRGAGRIVANLLALAQTLMIAQVGLGLLLLSDDGARRTTSTTSTARSPSARCSCRGCTRPRAAPRRLAWFAGTSALAAALAVRAFMTGS